MILPDWTRRWKGLLLVVLLISPALWSDEASVPPLLHDRGIFPIELFPGVDELDEHELLLEALQAHFPGRVLDESPQRPLENDAEPTGRESDSGVSYIRVGNLAAALPWIERNLTESVVLIDLRFVHGSLENSIALGSLLAGGDELAFDLIGQYTSGSGFEVTDRLVVSTDVTRSGQVTVIVLINGLTSGSLEAVLAELQAKQRILTIGTRSAGLTATYRRIPAHPGWYAINGEIKPVSTGSLVGIGLDPAIPVNVDSDDETVAYAGFDPERPLNTILEQAVEKERFDEARLLEEFSRGARPAPSRQPIEPGMDLTNADSEDLPESIEPQPIDQALRSAFYVIEGMRALGRIDVPIERMVED